MTDRPILFSAPMVRALLDGRKTQTRRILKPQPKHGYEPWQDECTGEWFIGGHGEAGDWILEGVRFAKGDRLWVRESWYAAHGEDATAPRDMDSSWKICPAVDWNYVDWGIKGKLRPGIFMPRWASRLTLTVTDVRVQHLQNCSEADCIAEGTPAPLFYMHLLGAPLDGVMVADPNHPHVKMTPRTWYRELWDTINGAGAWDNNPWIVGVTFTVEQRNIDA